MSKIVNYTIIALTIHEVPRVVEELRRRGQNDTADWLGNSAPMRYGAVVRDWMPFHDQTIKELLDEEAFLSQNSLVENLDATAANYEGFSDSNILVYFIDPFVTYLPKYQNLAQALDLFVCDGDQQKCVFLVHIAITPHIQKKLMQDSLELWKAVNKHWGSGHKVARASLDLQGIERDLVPTRPHPVAGQAGEVRFGSLPTRIVGIEGEGE